MIKVILKGSGGSLLFGTYNDQKTLKRIVEDIKNGKESVTLMNDDGTIKAYIVYSEISAVYIEKIREY